MSRDKKRLIALSPEEDARIVAAAEIANRPVARVIRELALEGLDARAERMLPPRGLIEREPVDIN